MGRQVRFRDALAVREFRALWVAELLSVAGDQLARVALAVLVYRQTSSAGWTALTYALTYLPSLLGGAFLSGLADRYPRRELMVVVDLGRALIAGAMALPFVPLPILIGLVFLLTLAGSPFKAAQQALLPTVLPGDTYVAGLAVRTVTNQAAHLAGFLGGGLLLVVLDPHVALGLNAGSFLLAAVLVTLGVRRRPAARSAAATGERGGTAGALRLIWRDRQLRGLVAVSWLVGLFVVPEGLAAPYAAGLGAATVAVGVLMAADPVGSIVGAWLVTRIPGRARSRLIIPLTVASGIPLAACVVYPGVVGSVALWAASGALSTMYVILAQERFTRRVPDHQRAAATGLASTGLLTSQGVAILGGGLAAELIGPALAIAGAGAAGAILAVLVGASWRASRSDDGESGDDAMTDPSVTSPYPSSPAPPPTGPAAEHGIGGAAGSIIVARNPDRPPPDGGEFPSRLPWRWALWQVPRRARIFIVAVELFAVVVTVAVGFRDVITHAELRTSAVLVGLGLAMAELTRHVERRRRRFNDTPHVNMTSVWGGSGGAAASAGAGRGGRGGAVHAPVLAKLVPRSGRAPIPADLLGDEHGARRLRDRVDQPPRGPGRSLAVDRAHHDRRDRAVPAGILGGELRARRGRHLPVRGPDRPAPGIRHRTGDGTRARHPRARRGYRPADRRPPGVDVGHGSGFAGAAPQRADSAA
jgi:MFS family permease